MQNQTQSTFTMRISTAGGADRCTATTDNAGAVSSNSMKISNGSNAASPVIDLMAAYRSSRIAAQNSLSSMRISSSSARPGSAYFRRAA